MSLAQMSEKVSAAVDAGFDSAAEATFDASGAADVAVGESTEDAGAAAAGPRQVGRPTEQGGTLQVEPEGEASQGPCCCALPHHSGGRWAGSGA